MLVLSRAENQKIMIGDDVVITVVALTGGRVRLGITAPRATTVDREEVYGRFEFRSSDCRGYSDGSSEERTRQQYIQRAVCNPAQEITREGGADGSRSSQSGRGEHQEDIQLGERNPSTADSNTAAIGRGVRPENHPLNSARKIIDEFPEYPIDVILEYRIITSVTQQVSLTETRLNPVTPLLCDNKATGVAGFFS